MTDPTHNISHAEGQGWRGRKCLSSRHVFFIFGAGIGAYKIEMCLLPHLAWKAMLKDFVELKNIYIVMQI